MIDLQEALDTAMLHLSEHLEAGGSPPALPKPERNPAHTDDYVWASEMWQCALRSALRRAHVAEFYPLEHRAKIDLIFRLRAGVVVAEILQQAMLLTYPDLVTVEAPCYSDELRLKGKVDLWYGSMLVEIKTSKSTKPYLSQVLQTLAYCLLHEERLRQEQTPAAIVLCNPFLANTTRTSYTVWYLSRIGDGFRVVDQDGCDWNNPRNTPEFLNYDTIRAEIKRLDNYATVLKHYDFGRDAEDLSLLAPHSIDDPDFGFLCADIVEEPKRYARAYTHPTTKRRYKAGEVRPGMGVPRCPYFCHGPGGAFTIWLDEEGQPIYHFEGSDCETKQPDLC